MKQADLMCKDNNAFLAGEINFSNVMSLRQKSLAQFNHHAPELFFDLSKVKSSDSSGLALMIEWIKLGNARHKKVKFLQVPKELLSIAKVSGLEDLILHGV